LDDVILNPGEVICDGRYEILNMLGQGGMGVVYKARSLSLKRDVAIKMLTHIDDAMKTRFSREAELLAKINHPAVVKLHDFIKAGAQGPLLVMEYVQGRDLSSVLHAPMEISEAVDLILGICSGVQTCHKLGIVHRDLKPSNIRLTEGNDWRARVKILDFGIAIPYDSPVLKARQARITQMGVVPGTPCFTAPELIKHEQPSDKCDQYGVALLLYMALTGREPFSSPDNKDLIQAILRGNYIAPRFFRPEIAAELERVIVRALNVDPNARFPSVVALALALLPFASAKANEHWTHYFTKAMRPVSRRLLEPVSAAKQEQEALPLMNRIEMLAGPAQVPAPASLPRRLPPTELDPLPAPPPRQDPRPAKQWPHQAAVKANRPTPSPVPRSKSRSSLPPPSLRTEILRGIFRGAIVGTLLLIVIVLTQLIFRQRSPENKDQPAPVAQPEPASVSK
jgi:serine/threonine-protein kinase